MLFDMLKTPVGRDPNLCFQNRITLNLRESNFGCLGGGDQPEMLLLVFETQCLHRIMV